MLYYFFRFLGNFGIPGSGMWSYISFRSLLAFILALLISAWFGARFIKYMHRHHISETQRDASIDPYLPSAHDWYDSMAGHAGICR